ncbi:GNAT family N-acetyltransferase [Campylobacter pinnipediorum]|uniref:GNAT family N-acetyltransferase n=2 Tax=Campylobacter pinnipediorum TaxID=1965231 RepID=UPI00112FBCCB|nr:GNAT family N-acetyltransferase [Campylobacter pinnipediorum]
MKFYNYKMIRKANTNEANQCINLLKLALDDIIYTLSKSNDEKYTNDFLISMFKSEQCRISYKNTTVFEKDNKIVGVMVSYGGKDVKYLDKHYKNIFEKECFDDEYYIDAIAVDEKYRGNKIATKLINYTDNLAKDKNYNKISLIVDNHKEKTMQFYQRLGFLYDQDFRVYDKDFKHMIKDIK